MPYGGEGLEIIRSPAEKSAGKLAAPGRFYAWSTRREIACRGQRPVKVQLAGHKRLTAVGFCGPGAVKQAVE
jgi:hypothetical protein